MKTKRYKKCILCEGATLAESVQIFNEEMLKLQDPNPDFERYNDAFLIYVTMYEEIPETIVEEKQQIGCTHKCRECSHCKRILTRKGEINKVTKKATCDLNDMTVYLDSSVCEVFYEEHQDMKLQTFNAEVVPLKSREEEMRKGA